MDLEQRKGLTYAFDHLVSSQAHPENAHAGDSADLAIDTFTEIGMNEDQVEAIEALAEHVAANYAWTGAGEDLARRIERGEA